MKIYYCDTFVLPLPEKHRFPMLKYEELRKRIEAEALFFSKAQLLLPPAASDSEILQVHCPDYLEALKSGQLDRKLERRIGFPYSPQLLERSRRSVGATLAACRAALEEGVGVNLAGGTHHAFRERGEGFCVFNDTAVALKTLQSEGAIEKALVIDTDVHQGNGTASVLAKNPEFFTFSIHGAKNFPFKKETSDLDIGLDDGAGDSEFLGALESALDKLSQIKADLVVFQSGADPYEKDKLGRLNLTKIGLLKRDQMVLQWCQQRELPVAVTMGGGYAPEVSDIVDIHLQTVKESYALYSRSRQASSPAV